MAALAEQDNSSLIQTLLGLVSGKSGTTNTSGSSTEAKTSSQDLLSKLQQTLNTTGSQQTTGSTTNQQTTSQSGSQVSTTKSDISAEGIAKMLQDTLSAAGTGVADIATGAKQAGIYNSSTQQLLTNDLLSRTAGELAKAQAGTTTTTTSSGANTVSGNQTTNQNVQSSQNQIQDQTQNQSTTGTQNTTGAQNQNVQIDQESALKNLDLEAILGAGGLAAGGSILLPLLQGLLGKAEGAAGASPGSGLGGIGQQLAQLLLGGSNPGYTVDTEGQGTNNSGLTPQQMESLVGSDFDVMSWLDQLMSESSTETSSIGDSNEGDWWDPSWDMGE